jgi:tetratricopeptide (TPR) repeat protein
MQEARQAGSRKKPSSQTKQEGPPQAAVKEYQTALQLMQQGKYEKAHAIFEKLITSGPSELLERSRVYLSACERNVRSAELKFDNLEEQYDYSVSLLNTGFYGEAEEQFEDILSKEPSADYAHYGLAILKSMTDRPEECLQHLSKAIELNAQNRIQARSDSDFQDMADDPRFTELLYPEVS